MKGVTFGSLHSYNDLGLILSSKEIGAPSVKVKKLDIEGADGSIDYTDFFGGPKYGEVNHKFTFTALVPRKDAMAHFAQVKNALHGQKMRIVLDDAPDYYYIGRLTVSSYTDERGIGKLTIDAVCAPWQYKAEKTVITRAIDGAETILLTNAKRRAVPLVTVAAESSLHIVYQTTNVWDLGSGNYTLPDLELAEGENAVEVTGAGTITFAWQEAVL